MLCEVRLCKQTNKQTKNGHELVWTGAVDWMIEIMKYLQSILKVY